MAVKGYVLEVFVSLSKWQRELYYDNGIVLCLNHDCSYINLYMIVFHRPTHTHTYTHTHIYTHRIQVRSVVYLIILYQCQFLGFGNILWYKTFSSVQFSCSVMSDSVTPWTAAHQASLSITNSRSLLTLMSVESVMPSDHLILCRPLLLPPSIFPSIRVFSNESVLHIKWPKYWLFSFNISPSSEYSGQISFWMDWLDLLADQGTLKSLLQHHSSKASILRRSAFFIVQLSHPYMTTGKTIALTRWTFVNK